MDMLLSVLLMFAAIIIIGGLLSKFAAGENPNDAKAPAQTPIISVERGNDSPTIFCYDGSALPALEWQETIRLRYHASPRRIRSIYTGTVSDCPNYLTYEGSVVGCIFDVSYTRYLDKLAERGKVYIYVVACGYNKRGWPQLFASLPSKRRLAQLAK